MSGKRTMPPGVTVVIPSFRPDDQLIATVKALSEVGTENIIVINDGSERKYDFFFGRLTEILPCIVLRHEYNTGKGAAIKTGIKYCIDNIPSCRAVVTVDGDGHHRALDVVTCAHKVIDHGDVVLGMRESDDPTILHRGHFGNRITARVIDIVCNFDFRVTDPLTGLRGFPAKYLQDIVEIDGSKYDYETNMILDISRLNIPMRTFSIKGIKTENEKNHSHYRPIRDTAKILFEIFRYFDKQLAYALSSIICYICEYVLFRILLGYVPNITIIGINYISRLAAATLNFFISRKLVFKVKKHLTSSAIKYIICAIIVMTVSSLLISLANSIFPTDANTVAKYIKPPIDTLLFFANYYIQKKWVFKSKN